MTDPETSRSGQHGEFEFLCVDRFLDSIVGATALASAMQLGIVDGLLRHQPCTPEELVARFGIDRRGLQLLGGLLGSAHVIEVDGERIRLSAEFMQALKFRDLLVAKLEFARLVAPDFLDLFPALLSDPNRFFQEARLFELFSYQRCFEATAENLAATERWVKITTVLTRYESEACLKYHDFSPYRRILDIGGNSGEFMLRICRQHPELYATVHDLPLVCEIGRRHVSGEPEAQRISFAAAGRSGGNLPAGFDLVTFKSMLHDWPDADMEQFVATAYRALNAGGRLLIFERGIFGATQQVPYALIPIMLFFRSYRSPERYQQALAAAGFTDIQWRIIPIEMPWILLTARK